MQVGELAPGVQEWYYRVTVDGVARAVESVSWDAELASGLPDPVAGVSGVSARTGTIRWAPQEAVTGVPGTPWTRNQSWPPPVGSGVVVMVGDGNTAWTVFTGTIDTTSGDLSSLSSRIVDNSDRLERTVTLPAVARRMPGEYAEGSMGDPLVYSLVQPWHAAYRCMRAAGWAVTAPSQPGYVAADVDLQGSLWPTVGTLRHGNDGVVLRWGDGYTYLSGGTIGYRAVSVPLNPGAVSRLWLRWDAQPDTDAVLNVQHMDAKYVRVKGRLNSVASRLAVTVEMWDNNPSAGGNLLGRLTGDHAVAVVDGTVWLDVAIPTSGTTVWYTYPRTDAPVGTPNSASKVVGDLGAQLTAAQRADMVSTWGPVVAFRVGSLTQTQWDTMSSHVGGLRVHAWGEGLVRVQEVSRAIEKRKASDVLAEIGSATLTAMWIDETGTMQWAPTDRLHAQAPILTVTTEQDIFELGWQESLQATRSRVNVDYLEAAAEYARRYTVTLYQPNSAATITENEPIEEFITPPGDEEWIAVDGSMSRASDNIAAFNRGEGSFFGAVIEDINGDYVWSSATNRQLQRLGLTTWKLTQTGTGPNKMLMSNPDDPGLYRSKRGVPLPILRGQARIMLADARVTGATTGPSWAPELDHDIKHWGRASDAQRVADWLSAQLASPIITLTNLEIAYDPRIQLGDMLLVDSKQFLGFSVNALVIGKSESHGDGARLSLTVRVTEVRTVFSTYEDFEAAYAGRNYSALESAWAGATYTGLENDPLERS